MTYRNWRILGLVAFACIACSIQAKRLRGLGDLGYAMDVIEQSYVEPVERRQLYQAAITGVTKALDQFSSYIPPEQFAPFQAQLHQEFGGLGIMVEQPSENDPITIVSAIYDSPAFHAGIQSGDILISVNDKKVEGMKIADASQLLRGQPGTDVTIQIERKDEPELITRTIRRAMIETESVTGDRRQSDGRWVFLMQANPEIAYIRIEIFGEKTPTELRNALASVRDKAKAIILDLRDNSGGLLSTATEICDMFLNEGIIVTVEGRNDIVETVREASVGVEFPEKLPMIVLVNSDSASASEVTAACLQDHKRAEVVGTRTYGKGSVQHVIDIEGGKAALRLTTAHYFPPSHRNIDKPRNAKDNDVWGVYPNDGLTIEATDEQVELIYKRLRDRGNPLKANNPKKSSDQSDVSTKENTESNSSDENEETSSIRSSRTDLDPSLANDPQLEFSVKHIESLMR